MIDGLYFFGQWVAEVDVSINKQANDLTLPTQLQATYADTFSLPDTTAIRKLLQNAEQLDAGGRDPYRLIPAMLIDEGEITFSGDAILRSFQGGWKVNLSAPLKGLFDQLASVKLSELDLSRYDHPWTIETISSYASNTEGIVYPAIDYGGLSVGDFSQDTLAPGIYAKTLVGAMLQAYGYRTMGSWTADPLYNRIVLPFVEEEPKAHDAQWRIDRQARVTVTGATPINPFGSTDMIVPFNRDNEPLSNWIDGKLNNYKAETYRYVCDSPMRLKVTAFWRFAFKVDFGAVEAMIIVEKNGQNVAQEYISEGGPYNLNLSKVTILNLNETIECRANDQIQIRYVLQKRTTFVQFVVMGFIREEDAWASFEPDISIIPGDTWPVAQNMPDLNCADILKSVALMCSGTFDVDDLAKTVTLRTLDSVIAQEANAQDLSTAVTENVEPENAVIIPPYGQKNLLKWKEQDETTLKGYGDGIITCDAQNIPPETPLFELPFSAVIDSKVSIADYGNPPFIETRTISGSGDNVKVDKKSAPACLVLVEPTKPVTVTVNVVTPELTIRKTLVPLTACWWHTRPTGLVTATNGFSLAFDRPVGSLTAEQTLIPRYFGSLKRILRRPRMFSVPVYLNPSRFTSLDLYIPVRLRAVRAGALDINDSYFYLNKVSGYQAGKSCALTLIPY